MCEKRTVANALSEREPAAYQLFGPLSACTQHGSPPPPPPACPRCLFFGLFTCNTLSYVSHGSAQLGGHFAALYVASACPFQRVWTRRLPSSNVLSRSASGDVGRGWWREVGTLRSKGTLYGVRERGMAIPIISSSPLQIRNCPQRTCSSGQLSSNMATLKPKLRICCSRLKWF